MSRRGKAEAIVWSLAVRNILVLLSLLLLLMRHEDNDGSKGARDCPTQQHCAVIKDGGTNVARAPPSLLLPPC
jgi:hypothetical protein